MIDMSALSEKRILVVGDIMLAISGKTSAGFPLIQQLKPDVLVKGADCRLDQVVGRDIVEFFGARIFMAPLLSGYSTTGIISRAKSRRLRQKSGCCASAASFVVEAYPCTPHSLRICVPCLRTFNKAVPKTDFLRGHQT